MLSPQSGYSLLASICLHSHRLSTDLAETLWQPRSICQVTAPPVPLQAFAPGVKSLPCFCPVVEPCEGAVAARGFTTRIWTMELRRERKEPGKRPLSHEVRMPALHHIPLRVVICGVIDHHNDHPLDTNLGRTVKDGRHSVSRVHVGFVGLAEHACSDRHGQSLAGRKRKRDDSTRVSVSGKGRGAGIVGGGRRHRP